MSHLLKLTSLITGVFLPLIQRLNRGGGGGTEWINLRLLRFFTQRCNYWARLRCFASVMRRKRSDEFFVCAGWASFAVTKWLSELCNLTHWRSLDLLEESYWRRALTACFYWKWTTLSMVDVSRFSFSRMVKSIFILVNWWNLISLATLPKKVVVQIFSISPCFPLKMAHWLYG